MHSSKPGSEGALKRSAELIMDRDDPDYEDPGTGDSPRVTVYTPRALSTRVTVITPLARNLCVFIDNLSLLFLLS